VLELDRCISVVNGKVNTHIDQPVSLVKEVGKEVGIDCIVPSFP